MHFKSTAKREECFALLCFPLNLCTQKSKNMKTKLILLAALTAVISFGSCSKDNKEKLVQTTWTLRNAELNSVYTDLVKNELSYDFSESAAQDSADKIANELDAARKDVQYTFREDGTCTIKSTTGQQEARWQYTLYKNKGGSDDALIRLTQNGVELETWQIYNDDFRLGHTCGCINVLVAGKDSTIQTIIGEANVVFTGELHPASEEGLERF